MFTSKKHQHGRSSIKARLCSLLAFAALIGASIPARAEDQTQVGERILVVGRRLFDGVDFQSEKAILIEGPVIVDVGPREVLKERASRIIDLGDATILPGFIELHAHSLVRNLPQEVILRHGITTLRDVGGPLSPPTGGTGRLRVLTAGPIITVQQGYPLSVFGKGYLAETVQTAEDAKALVRKLVQGGAAVIKVALEPGGEPGAPWSHEHDGAVPPPWPIASVDIIAAVVEEAHRLHRIVTAHVSENKGASIALAAGVDEWAHVPCSELDEALVRQAVKQKVKIVTTLDTLSSCQGAFANARKLAKAGASFLYGAEIAHLEIPWGIDARELQLMRHMAEMSDVDILRSATSEAGKELGLAPLGALRAGAPADLIAVKGDPRTNFKVLEYPDLVISGGRTVVDNFASPRSPADLPPP
jgi:imidazolonepropionase-like amidohydrolase